MRKVFILLCLVTLCLAGCSRYLNTITLENAYSDYEAAFPITFKDVSDFEVAVEDGAIYASDYTLSVSTQYKGDTYATGYPATSAELLEIDNNGIPLYGVIYHSQSGFTTCCLRLDIENSLHIYADSAGVQSCLDNIENIVFHEDSLIHHPGDSLYIEYPSEINVGVKESSQYKGLVYTGTLLIVDDENNVQGYVPDAFAYETESDLSRYSENIHEEKLDSVYISDITKSQYKDTGYEIWSGVADSGDAISCYEGILNEGTFVYLVCFGDTAKTESMLADLEIVSHTGESE